MSRFIGAYIGDGWSSTKVDGGYTVGLAIARLGEPHYNDYLDLLNRLFPKTNWRNHNVGFVGCNKELWYFVREIIGTDSYTKKLPAEYYVSPEESRLELLGGYIDADGHVMKNPSNLSRCHFGSVNKKLVHDIRDLAILCDVKVTSVKDIVRKVNVKPGIQKFSECIISGMTSYKIPMWHRTKKERSMLMRNKYVK